MLRLTLQLDQLEVVFQSRLSGQDVLTCFLSNPDKTSLYLSSLYLDRTFVCWARHMSWQNRLGQVNALYVGEPVFGVYTNYKNILFDNMLTRLKPKLVNFRVHNLSLPKVESNSLLNNSTKFPTFSITQRNYI